MRKCLRDRRRRQREAAFAAALDWLVAEYEAAAVEVGRSLVPVFQGLTEAMRPVVAAIERLVAALAEEQREQFR